jgi:hypothetical protein
MKKFKGKLKAKSLMDKIKVKENKDLMKPTDKEVNVKLGVTEEISTKREMTTDNMMVSSTNKKMLLVNRININKNKGMKIRLRKAIRTETIKSVNNMHKWVISKIIISTMTEDHKLVARVGEIEEGVLEEATEMTIKWTSPYKILNTPPRIH